MDIRKSHDENRDNQTHFSEGIGSGPAVAADTHIHNPHGKGMDYSDRHFNLASVKASGYRVDGEWNAYIDLTISYRREGEKNFDLVVSLKEDAVRSLHHFSEGEVVHAGYFARRISEEFKDYGRYSEPIKFELDLPYLVMYDMEGAPRKNKVKLSLIGAYTENGGLNIETALPDDFREAVGRLGSVPSKMQIRLYPVSDDAQKTLSEVDFYINRWR